eukprot:29697-Pelagococcus_subviridis.AAC.2
MRDAVGLGRDLARRVLIVMRRRRGAGEIPIAPQRRGELEPGRRERGVARARRQMRSAPRRDRRERSRSLVLVGEPRGLDRDELRAVDARGGGDQRERVARRRCERRRDVARANRARGGGLPSRRVPRHGAGRHRGYRGRERDRLHRLRGGRERGARGGVDDAAEDERAGDAGDVFSGDFPGRRVSRVRVWGWFRRVLAVLLLRAVAVPRAKEAPLAVPRVRRPRGRGFARLRLERRDVGSKRFAREISRRDLRDPVANPNPIRDDDPARVERVERHARDRARVRAVLQQRAVHLARARSARALRQNFPRARVLLPRLLPSRLVALRQRAQRRGGRLSRRERVSLRGDPQK